MGANQGTTYPFHLSLINPGGVFGSLPSPINLISMSNQLKSEYREMVSNLTIIMEEEFRLSNAEIGDIFHAIQALRRMIRLESEKERIDALMIPDVPDESIKSTEFESQITKDLFSPADPLLGEKEKSILVRIHEGDRLRYRKKRVRRNFQIDTLLKFGLIEEAEPQNPLLIPKLTEKGIQYLRNQDLLS